jgi:hypothetical protein
MRVWSRQFACSDLPSTVFKAIAQPFHHELSFVVPEKSVTALERVAPCALELSSSCCGTLLRSKQLSTTNGAYGLAQFVSAAAPICCVIPCFVLVAGLP